MASHPTKQQQQKPEKQPQLPITLYRGWLDLGKHVWSPFVVKLEARLRFSNIPYKTEAGSVRNAPKGKIPYVNFGDGEMLGDSTLIIKRLVQRGVLPDLNGRLEAAEWALDLSLRALLQEKLYFNGGRERWIENYYPMREHILQSLPYPARVLVGLLCYRKMVSTMHLQGTGRYSEDEIAETRLEIWETMAELLTASKRKSGADLPSSEPFWLLAGSEPTEGDACLFGFIVSILICTACPDSQAVVKGLPILLEYAGRIHDAYFPDYESVIPHCHTDLLKPGF